MTQLCLAYHDPGLPPPSRGRVQPAWAASIMGTAALWALRVHSCAREAFLPLSADVGVASPYPGWTGQMNEWTAGESHGGFPVV